MEEIKTKKKLNKKPLILCLVLALVFGIVGFIDIKSNAAESLYSLNVRCDYTYTIDGKEKADSSFFGTTYTSESPIYVYAHTSSIPGYETSFPNVLRAFAISRSYIYGSTNDNRTFTDNDGNLWYCLRGFDSGKSNDELVINSINWTVNGAEEFYLLEGNVLSFEGFVESYNNGTLNYKKVVDYDNLPIDDDMLVPSNLKRNVILNDTNVSTGLYMDTYDLVTWNNTTEEYRIELQRCPVVQIYKTPLFGSNEFIKEFVGEWKTEQIFEEVTNEYLKRTDTKGLLDEDADTLTFKGNLTYDLSGLEQDYIYFGYRIRYVDIENNVASPWLVLMPTHSKDNYETFLEYGDSSQGDKNDGNGIVNEYKDLEDLNGAIDDVKTENDFKDKYEVVDGNADTQEVMNWLNTVVSFIKGTPSIVTSVLSFLPQPILYGMYITIFLGCIASAIAIIKALI